MKNFEWTLGTVAFGVMLVVAEGIVLWPIVRRLAQNRFTGRVRTGCALFFFLGLIASFFGAVGLATVHRQSSRMVEVKAQCVSVLNATSLRVAPVKERRQITVHLLGVMPFEHDTEGKATKYLTSQVAPPGKHMTVRLPEGTTLEADEVTGYVFTGSTMGSEAVYRLIDAGMVRRDTNAVHHIVTLQSLYESGELQAKREGRGLWRGTPE